MKQYTTDCAMSDTRHGIWGVKMGRVAVAGIGLAVLMASAAPLRAQTVPVFGVTACGTPPTTIANGKPAYLTVLTTGVLCSGGAGSGTSTVQGSGPTADTTALSTLPTSTSAAAGGLAPVVGGTTTAGVVVKASAGNLYDGYAVCTAACWLMIFNSTTVPADGATTSGIATGNLQDCIPVSAGLSGSLSAQGLPPEIYTVGISAVVSSTACAIKTASATGIIHIRAK